MSFPDPDDVQAAIARVEESRQSHVLWHDYWTKTDAHNLACPGPDACPWGDHAAADAEQLKVSGGAQHQLDVIAGYDHVLDVLRGTTNAQGS